MDQLALENPTTSTPEAAAGPRSIRIGGPSSAAQERLLLPAMGSLVALLYGVDVLFVGSRATAWIELVLAAVILLLGRDTLKRGLESFFYRLQLGQDTLLSIGALVSFFYSFLICTLSSLDRLATGHFVVTPNGDLLPTLYFTTAGTVIFGATLCRRLAVRGDSILKERWEGQWQRLARITEIGSIDRQLLRRNWEERSPLAALAERIGIYWTLSVVLLVTLAVVGGLMDTAGLNRAIVGSVVAFLVCSSPTAFSVVVRATQSWGSIRAGTKGFFFQNRRAIEGLAQVDAVCLNRLGILTTGCPQVTDVLPIQKGVSADEVIYFASVLEAQTEHPYRDAILLRISGSARTIPRVRGFRCVPGRGLRAVFQGQELLLGGKAYLGELDIAYESVEEQIESLEKEGKTVLILCKGGEVLGLVALSDERRAEAPEALTLLRDLGVRTVVTSGESRTTIESLTQGLELDEIHAALSQEGCVQMLRELRGRGFRVAMIGGGVSKASILAQTDLGIAFGVGPEGLIQSSEVVLQGHDLRELPALIKLARKVRGWIWVQLGAAFLLQALIIAAVAAFWIDHSVFTLGAAHPWLSTWLLDWPYWPDLLGFFAALLPAAVIWLSCGRLRSLETCELDAFDTAWKV